MKLLSILLSSFCLSAFLFLFPSYSLAFSPKYLISVYRLCLSFLPFVFISFLSASLAASPVQFKTGDMKPETRRDLTLFLRAMIIFCCSSFHQTGVVSIARQTHGRNLQISYSEDVLMAWTRPLPAWREKKIKGRECVLKEEK